MTNLQGPAFSTKAIPSLRYVLESLAMKQVQETLTLVCESQYAQFFTNSILHVEAAHFAFLLFSSSFTALCFNYAVIVPAPLIQVFNHHREGLPSPLKVK